MSTQYKNNLYCQKRKIKPSIIVYINYIHNYTNPKLDSRTIKNKQRKKKKDKLLEKT